MCGQWVSFWSALIYTRDGGDATTNGSGGARGALEEGRELPPSPFLFFESAGGGSSPVMWVCPPCLDARRGGRRADHVKKKL